MDPDVYYTIVKSGDTYALRLINPHGCSHNREYFKSLKAAQKRLAEIYSLFNEDNDHETDR